MARVFRPRLLDLFCGGGGASEGYRRAGFEVVGVDIAAHPNYPFAFHQADALAFPLDGYDAIHASPPCQHYSAITKRTAGAAARHPALVAPIRERLIASGVPYVIENVMGAPLIGPVMLCGTSFGRPLERHRLFESNVPLAAPRCNHGLMPRRIAIKNHGDTLTRFVPVYGSGGCKARHLWDFAMGIDWMSTRELAESIPPYYTEFIGLQIIRKAIGWGTDPRVAA